MGILFWKKKKKTAISEKDLIDSAEKEVMLLSIAVASQDWEEIQRILDHSELGMPYLTDKMSKASRKEFARIIGELRTSFDIHRKEIKSELTCSIAASLKTIEKKL